MNNYRFSVIVEKDADGYFASCNELQGCYTQGETYEEAIGNIKDAIALHVEDRLEAGEEISQPQAVSLTLMDLVV
ncbi:MAG: type II toxin-antitoxin system HicB family antitoxin [Pyrinomonadaceae bacterium]|nr:type II toxin-antitoxin system HicB family antitoxin [Pyrinomonadaceae bacterium]